jgi:phosphoribosyl 1,2-cyclic phosphodiesterase
MKLISLASGSKGNSYYINSGSTSILVDAGLSAKQLSIRMHDMDIDPSKISAVFITHEHVDHIGGLRVFAKKTDIPVFMNEKCLLSAKEKYKLDEIKDIHLFNTGHIIDYQDIRIHPMSISHDTSDPVCFTLDDGKYMTGIVTDLGKMNTLVLTNLKKLDTLILESNHDLNMLKANSRYPEYVKQRIRSAHGHLSNSQSAEAAVEIIAHGKLKHLMLAHLSENNNTEAQAALTYDRYFKEAGIDLPYSFAKQHQAVKMQ